MSRTLQHDWEIAAIIRVAHHSIEGPVALEQVHGAAVGVQDLQQLPLQQRRGWRPAQGGQPRQCRLGCLRDGARSSCAVSLICRQMSTLAARWCCSRRTVV